MGNKSIAASSCPFCNNSIKESVFLESEYFYAIYNIAPVLEGHSLVIPRRHVENTFEFTLDEMELFFKFANQTTDLLLKAFQGEGFDWSLQQGEVAGQSVSHVHLHILIRKKNDIHGTGEWYEKVRKNESILLDSKSRSRLSSEEISLVVQKIRNTRG